MSKKNLGKVELLPWDNITNYFTEKPSGFTGNGGYKISGNKCYVLLGGTINNLVLPSPKTSITISYVFNGKINIEEFNGTINKQGEIQMLLTYEIIG